MCHVTSQEVLPENTVIYGSDCERRVQGEKPFVSVFHRLLFFDSFTLLLISATNLAVGFPHKDSPQLPLLNENNKRNMI
jgi:hypothetical protein